MKLTDVGTTIPIIAGVVTGTIVIWKKGIKPAIKWLKKHNAVINLTEKVFRHEAKINDLTFTVTGIMKLAETCLFIADSTGKVTLINQSLCNLFGAEDDEKLKGYNMFSFFQVSERALARSEWIQLVKDDSVNSIEKDCIVVNAKTREHMELKLYAEFTRNEKGEILKILGKFKINVA